ncbi:MAG: hypothetical protein M3417_10535 [Actinomycetota bacterium]|nr:hypothetical protein [Actinomycetota bacterium]
MIASIVDVGALWQTVWSAALAGVLVIVCCSVAVLGAARAHEHRAAGLGGAATGPWVLLALVGGATMTAVVVYGLVLVVG